MTAINNEKLTKIEAEIVKLKKKVADYSARLRELERLKTETENAGIIALVRGVDILPDELMAFIKERREQIGGIAAAPSEAHGLETTQEDKEEFDREKE